PEGDPAVLPPPPAPGETVRYIYTTSGTTADPKCALHSDTSLITAGVAMNRALMLTADDSGCLPVPIAHPGGFSFLVAMFEQGFPTTFVDPWSVDRAVTVMNRYGATVMGGSTAHFIMLLAEQRKDPGRDLIPTVNMFTGGGAALPAETFRQIRDELGVRPAYGYGMTECPTIAMGSRRHNDEQLSNTAGELSAGLEVRILGANGQALPAGEEGEVELRGPMLFQGYADPRLDAEVFTADGWFHTGDRGHIRRDNHIVLTGRSKDVIIRKGENVSPMEVEAIVQLVPGVAAVAVIGLPDAERGEMVCAVIQLVEGAQAPTLHDIRQVCDREGLMIQKVPERLEIVEQFPRNATMKILKHELRAQFLAAKDN
ncbi:MAG: AMP-dependent synthetase and ligase, partial [Acidimicrobiia bacterium]|nr:AMP-dependent synthetase and ligase [Acidimicrobiia bacterium]